MHILFLCHRFLDTQIGGLAEFLHHLTACLKKKGIHCVIYAQNENNENILSPAITLANGIECYTGPFIKPSWFVNSKKLNPFIELCKQQKIDLIHAQGIYRSGYMAMRASRQLQIPFVVTSHSDILSASSARMKRGKIQRRCARILREAQGATHLTPMMADAAHAIYDTREKSAIVGNGIDISAWQHTATEKNYLFAIGRLEREKGFHVLIDAFAKLIMAGKNTSLVIAGTGSEEKNLQQQAQQLGLPVITHYTVDENIPKNSVIFTGYIKGQAKTDLMSHASILLFSPQPAIWEEPFGIVQIEAMAAGKALIASDTAATRYLQQQGLQAKTVVADNANAWASAINELLENSILRKQMGEMNKQNAGRFDWEIIAEQYICFFKTLLP